MLVTANTPEYDYVRIRLGMHFQVKPLFWRVSEENEQLMEVTETKGHSEPLRVLFVRKPVRIPSSVEPATKM